MSLNRFLDNKLCAVDYNSLGGNTPMISIKALSDRLYVKLLDAVRGFAPYRIYEVEPFYGDIQPELSIGTDAILSDNKQWIDVKTSALDIKVGLHIYRIDFVNVDNNDTIQLYFGYHIQDDNVEKPYIYMKRDSES